MPRCNAQILSHPSTAIMAEINPSNPNCLTDKDVNYSFFSCCGDEDLVFLRCPACGHIWIECYECSIWFVDLTRRDKRESCLLTSDDHRCKCPKCDHEFEDLHYLSDENCHKYLPTVEQVALAGFARFLSEEKKNRLAARIRTNAGRQGMRNTFWQIAGGTLGAMGWILGAALNLLFEGYFFDAAFTVLCSLGVAFGGLWAFRQKQAGKVVNMWVLVVGLLTGSMIFGLCAFLWLHQRGTLEPIIDPEGKYPLFLNFLAPALIGVAILVTMIPPVRKWLSAYWV
ncbi:MAG: hypothetical protein AAF456_07480 [Planctomycetota bacterium]